MKFVKSDVFVFIQFGNVKRLTKFAKRNDGKVVVAKFSTTTQRSANLGKPNHYLLNVILVKDYGK